MPSNPHSDFRIDSIEVKKKKKIKAFFFTSLDDMSPLYCKNKSQINLGSSASLNFTAEISPIFSKHNLHIS